MTIGNWSTLQTYQVPTDCGSQSTVQVGSTVAWEGQDNPPLSELPPPERKRIREAHYVLNPNHVPYRGGRFLTKIDPSRVAEMGGLKYGTIFDAARRRELSITQGPSLDAGFGQPHAFAKAWTHVNLSVVTGFSSTPGYPPMSCTPFAGGGLPYLPPSPWSADDDWKLLERLRAKVTKNSFNAANFLGAEGKDTIRWMGATTQRILKAQRLIRKGAWEGAMAVLRSFGRHQTNNRSRSDIALQLDIYKDLVSQTVRQSYRKEPWHRVGARQWLEYHLAIEPLLGDVYAGAEQLAHSLHRPWTQTLRASVTRRVSFGNTYTMGCGTYRKNLREVRKSIVAYYTQPPDTWDFSGFSDPEVVLWNALPLTFVADWIYDIGGYLQARATRSALLGGVFVTSIKSSHDVSHLIAFGGLAVPSSDGAGQFLRSGTFERTVSSALDVPSPDVTPLGAFSSWQRLVTLFSLTEATGTAVRYS